MSPNGPLLRLTPHHHEARTHGRLIRWWQRLWLHTGEREAWLSTDSLTGLPDRAGCLAQGQVLQLRARQLGVRWPMAVLLAELAGAREVLQRHGPQVAQEAVLQGSLALRSRLRRGDLVGRWAATAFVVVLPPTDPRHLPAIARRLQQQVRLRCREVPMGLRLGVAPCAIDRPLVEAAQRAESALLKAMPPSGEGIRVWTPGLE
jgi:GGDEF domain-containing protein